MVTKGPFPFRWRYRVHHIRGVHPAGRRMRRHTAVVPWLSFRPSRRRRRCMMSPAPLFVCMIGGEGSKHAVLVSVGGGRELPCRDCLFHLLLDILEAAKVPVSEGVGLVGSVLKGRGGPCNLQHIFGATVILFLTPDERDALAWR